MRRRRATDALLATRDGVIIGHGMAADVPGPCGDRSTDIGVVVADAWQHRGVGSALVRGLITGAQVRGATAVTMDVMHGNDRALAMIRGHWPAARTRRSRDCNTLCIRLADVEQSQSPAQPARPARPGRPLGLPYTAAAAEGTVRAFSSHLPRAR